jgi:predicted HicB family RNase H-like nuclease
MPKKDFKNEFNPALQFISNSESEENQENEVQNFTPAIPMKRNPLYIETKSKRFQMLMQPRLHKKLKDIAEEKGTSVNELIHSILDQYTKKNK